MGKTESELKQIATTMDEERLRTAFRRVPFSYGTTGKNSGVVPPSNVTLSTHSSQRKWELPGYDPGPRRDAVMRGGLQMMDMYYGNGGRLTDSRDPVINEFVLAATGLTGVGKAVWAHKKVSPRLAYFAQHGNAQEGWAKTDPGQTRYGVTTTKEISRIIRWGLGEYGGTLIYDGAEVTYSGVFQQTPKSPAPGDTDLEARGLFTHFRPGESRARFGRGNGQIIFHWYSEETIPTLLHFASTWVWNEASHAAKLRMDRRNFMIETLGEEGFWNLPRGEYRSEMARRALTAYAKTFPVSSELERIWKNFAVLPKEPSFEQAVLQAP